MDADRPPAAGMLLISSAALVDPNFARSIVLLLSCDEDGALGLVLNRPSDVEVSGVLDGWDDLLLEPALVFGGGPVEPTGVLGVATLHEGAVEPEGWRPMFGRTGVIDLDARSAELVGAVAGLRIYAGYAGWSAAQLEMEIAEGSWYVVPALAEDLGSADPAGLWTRVLRRQPGKLSLLVTMPSDPVLN